MIPAKVKLIEGVSYIKRLRDMHNLSREAFAAKIGTTASSVYRWETGVHACSMTSAQWKNFYFEILEPLGIGMRDLPDDLGAPYVKAA